MKYDVGCGPIGIDLEKGCGRERLAAIRNRIGAILVFLVAAALVHVLTH